MKGYFLEMGIVYHLNTETHCHGRLHLKELTSKMSQHINTYIAFLWYFCVAVGIHACLCFAVVLFSFVLAFHVND